MNILFPRRIGRLSYFIRGLVCSFAFEALINYADASSWGNAFRDPWILLSGLAIVFYWLIFVILARARDVGMRWFWLLLLLIPGVNIGLALVLLFSRTQPLLEQEGPNPEASGATALTSPSSTPPLSDF